MSNSKDIFKLQPGAKYAVKVVPKGAAVGDPSTVTSLATTFTVPTTNSDGLAINAINSTVIQRLVGGQIVLGDPLLGSVPESGPYVFLSQDGIQVGSGDAITFFLSSGSNQSRLSGFNVQQTGLVVPTAFTAPNVNLISNTANYSLTLKPSYTGSVSQGMYVSSSPSRIQPNTYVRSFRSAPGAGGASVVVYLSSSVTSTGVSNVTFRAQDASIKIGTSSANAITIQGPNAGGVFDVPAKIFTTLDGISTTASSNRGFYLDENGNFRVAGASGAVGIDGAGNLSVSGSIVATAGNIGGLTLAADKLSASSPGSYVGVSGSGNYAFWAGSANPALAPFSVTNTGIVTASNLVITNSVTVGNLTGSWSGITPSSSMAIFAGATASTGAGAAFWVTNTGSVFSTGGASFQGPIFSSGSLVGSYLSGTSNNSGSLVGGAIFVPNSSNPTFKVDSSGNMTASNAYLSGSIISNSGSIGGWTIAPGALRSGSIVLSSGSNPKIYIGAGNSACPDTPFYVDSTGTLSLGNKFQWTGSALQMGDPVGSTVGFQAPVNPSASSIAIYAGSNLSGASAAPFRVDYSGNLTATNAYITGSISATSGSIGGFAISGSTLYGGQSGSIVGLNPYNSNAAIFAGATSSVGTNAKFWVTNSGSVYATAASFSGPVLSGSVNLQNAVMYLGTSGAIQGGAIYVPSQANPLFSVSSGGYLIATGASVSGSITATAGNIGNWLISSGNLTSGTGASVVGLSTGNYALYAGNATPSSAPFSVTNTGNLTATNANIVGTISSTLGNIGGIYINSDSISAASSSTYATQILNTGPSVFLQYETNPPIDSSSNNYPVSISGAGTLYSTAGFNGIGRSVFSVLGIQIVSQILNSSYTGASSNVSIEFWVNGAVASTSWAAFAGKTEYTRGWYIQSTAAPSNSLQLIIYTDALSNQNGGVVPVLDNKWHHVVYQIGSGTASSFIDGQYFGSTTYNAGTTNISSSATFFVNHWANSGVKDQFAVYHRLLSSAEILANYNAGIAARGFSVFNNGQVNINNANVSGNINATSGSIGGFNISGSALYGGPSGSIVGFNPYNASAVVFAGATSSAGTNAIFWVSGNGNVYSSGGASFTGPIISNASVVAPVISGLATNSGSIIGGAIYVPQTGPYKFIVDSSGNLTATSASISGSITSNSGNIGGWTITAGSLTSGTGASAVGLSTGNYAIYAGNSTPASAPFSVTNTGILTASGANITGNINANSGSIGGFLIGNNNLSSTGIVLSSSSGFNLGSGQFTVNQAGAMVAQSASITGQINANSGSVGGWAIAPGSLTSGTGATSVGLTTGAYAVYAGNATPSSAPFSVTNSGNLYAQNAVISGSINASSGTFSGVLSATTGSIGGFLISNNSLSSTGVVLSSSTGLNLGSGQFTVNQSGAMLAQNASVTGQITAGTGNIAGWTLTSQEIGTGVGANRVALNSTTGSPKIYIGYGNYGTGDTGFYADSKGYFSLGNQLTFAPGKGTASIITTPTTFINNSGSITTSYDNTSSVIIPGTLVTASALPTGVRVATVTFTNPMTASLTYIFPGTAQTINATFQSDNLSLLTVNGTIRGAVDSVTPISSPTLFANITSASITTASTVLFTASAGHFFSPSTVLIFTTLPTTNNLNLLNYAASAGNAYQITSTPNSTQFTINYGGLALTAGNVAATGRVSIQQLTMGLHPSEGIKGTDSWYHDPGTGVRLDQYNWWLVNNQFRVGNPLSYFKYDGSQFRIQGGNNYSLLLQVGANNATNQFAITSGSTGTYNNSNTPFYVDGNGFLSMGTGLLWDGTNLTVNGNINVTGGNALTNAVASSTYATNVALNSSSSTLNTSITTSSTTLSASISTSSTTLNNAINTSSTTLSGSVTNVNNSVISVTSSATTLNQKTSALNTSAQIINPMTVISAGAINAGKTAYNTGIGWWLDYNSGTPRLDIGNPAGNYIQWDGASLTVNGTINVSGGNAATNASLNTASTTLNNNINSSSTSLNASVTNVSGSTTALNTKTADFNANGDLINVMTVIQAGAIAAGKTAYNTGTGWLMEYNSGTPRLDIGTTSNYLKFDGTNVLIAGTASISGSVVANAGAVGGWNLTNTSISSGSINLVSSGTPKIYIGQGTYNSSNTPFYVDGSGSLSLGTGLTWDGTNLNINGNVNVQKAPTALNQDPQVSSSTAWIAASPFTSGSMVFATVPDGQTGPYVIRNATGVSLAYGTWVNSSISNRILFDPNRSYRVSAWIRNPSSPSANGTYYLGVAAFDVNGNNIYGGDGSQWFYAVNGQRLSSGSAWTRITGTFGAGETRTFINTASPNTRYDIYNYASARYISPLFILNYASSAGYYEIQDVRIEELVSAGLLKTDLALVNQKLRIGDTASNQINLIAGTTGTPGKIYIGSTGSFNDSNTPFYTDGSGSLSLGQKLTWNGSTLNIIGTASISGSIVANSGSVGGWDIGTSALSSGSINLISGAAPKIYIGAGTYSSSNTPFYVDNSGSLSLGNKLTWDSNNLSIIGSASISGSVVANSGQVGGWTIGQYTLSNSYINLFSGSSGALGKIYIGSGSFNNSNTVFYVDNSGYFSISDKLSWNPSASQLSIVGSASISGSIVANSGTIAGWTIQSGSLIATGASISGTGGLALGSPAKFTVNTLGDMVANSASINGSITSSVGNIGGWTLSNNSLSSGSVSLISGASAKIYIGAGTYSSSTTPFYVDNSGSLSIGNKLTWNGSRLLIGDQTGGTVGFQAPSNPSASDIAIYAGASALTGASAAPFRVTYGGVMYATGASISGSITALAGNIGGWTVNSNSLTSANVGLYAPTSPASSEIAFFAGSAVANRATAPFRVDYAGNLYASSASISGKINGLYIGFGGGNNSTNIAIGNNQPLFSNTTGSRNIAAGYLALFYNTTGTDNLAVGQNALYNNLTGINNLAIGLQSLASNTGGMGNIGIGINSLYINTIGLNNIGMGINSLYSNLNGNENLAIGSNSLFSNTTGQYNVALGYLSLYTSPSGTYNISVGERSMYLSQSGNNNIAIGSSAMYYNITGDNNIAIGREALSEQIGPGPSGGIGGYAENNNIAIGFQALRSFSGVYNVAVGIGSMSSASGWGNVSIGYGAIQGVKGFGNTAVGYGAGSQSSWTGNYNTFIGYNTTAAQFSGTTYNGTVAIGTDSGGAGARASADNQIVIGTASHSVHVPGLLYHDNVWTTPTFNGAWTSVASGYDTVGYKLYPDGRVALKGLIKNGTPVSTASVLFTLPVGYRPSGAKIFPVLISGAGATWRLNVAVAGTVALDVQTGWNTASAGAMAFTSLEGIFWDINS